MADTEAFGGSGWQQLLQQLMQWAGQLALAREQATGYVTPPVDQNVQEKALRAIWNKRPDLQQHYKNLRGKDYDEKKWSEYMNEWLGYTTEQDVYNDPVGYAQKQGWYTPPAGYQSNPAAKPTLEREVADWNRQQAQNNLLAQQRGPGDWTQYWNTVRTQTPNAAGIPSWALGLAKGVVSQPSGGNAYGAPFTGFPGASGTTGTTGQPLGSGIQQQQSMQSGANGQMGLPMIRPNSVTPVMWNNLLPSEQAGVGSMVEAQGGYMPDWVRMMQQAAPKGNSILGTTWK